MKILITGTAGFIGFHAVEKMAGSGLQITGLDSINDYYDVNLKKSRLEETGIPAGKIKYNKIIKSNKYDNYEFIQLKLEDRDNISKLFKEKQFDYVCHLAAQAGVRYSLENPHAYIDSNISGFINVLEGCRHNNVKHLVYASSSSVYGLNTKMPFRTSDNVDHPISLYAASKKSNELMAHTYSYLYKIPSTGLRFFTVYGPWGRPDMAPMLFAKAILENKPIKVFNHGNMKRDFTYVDDIIEGVTRVMDHIPLSENNWNGSSPDPASSIAPYRLYNIGNNNPVNLMDFIREMEKALDKKAELNMLPIQPGDVPETYADVEGLARDIQYKPDTSLRTGVEKFVQWYRSFYNI